MSFANLLGELVEELFDWDSRFWRTLLPLLFRPGFLTAEYIRGRRARYVPPLRLYLIISFFMFLVMSAGGDSIRLMSDQALDEVGGGVATVEVQAPAAGADTTGQEEGGRSDDRFDLGFVDEYSPQWSQDLERRLEQNAVRLSAQPGAFTEALYDYLPQLMFLMLPVFALLLRLAYLFSPFHYLHHLIFTLHFYSFVYLLYLLGAGVENWIYSEGIAGWLVATLAIYLVFGLRRAYGSGMAGAATRALVLLLVNAFFLLLGFAVVVLVVLALA